MIMNAIWESISPLLDFTLILSIISLGEIVKRYWKSENVKKFTKVLIVSLIFTTVYYKYFKIDLQILVVSVLISNWLYEFIVKAIISLAKKGLNYIKGSSFFSKNDFVGHRPDDR